MKTITLILVCCITALASQAQWANKFGSQDKHFFYTSGQYIMGKCNGGSLGLNYVFKEKMTVSLGYSASNKGTCSLPDEYLKSATTYVPTSGVEPFQNSENIHIMLGRVFKLNPKSSIRFLLQGGPALSTVRTPEFQISGSQYDYDMISSKKVSLIFNPKVEIPLCCMIGFSVGPMIVINDTQKYIGAGIGLMYGIVGRGKS